MKTVGQLARKAGIKNDCDGVWCTADQLQRFHDLAIAQYRESLLAGVGEAVAWRVRCPAMGIERVKK